jgi:outer membrane protein assembly factor BamB
MNATSRRHLSALSSFVLAACLLAPIAARGADPDELDGPWATVHADNSGTASSADTPYLFTNGWAEEKWRLDVTTPGHDRPGGRASLTFDAAGNIYWITNNGGGTGGKVRLVSASPAGEIRWAGNDGAGNIHQLGSLFSGASPVVGKQRVYGAGDIGGTLQVAAYDKATGERIWETDLSPALAGIGQTLTPVLYGGKLYVVGILGDGFKAVHQVDAETGDVDWASTVDEVNLTAGICGQMAFVPDAFDVGVHGIYFNGDRDPNATGGLPAVYGIKVEATKASLGWSAIGGKVARSHMIYSSDTNHLYALTWSDYGAQVYVYDPALGFVGQYANSLNSGHGFYDVGALDFAGAGIIGGGFDGNIFRYIDSGEGAISEQIMYRGGFPQEITLYPFWGETRAIGALVQTPGGASVLIAGTNSATPACNSHVVAVDVTNGKLLWEHDTGVLWIHQYQYAGGPVVGPDGKVYFFRRPSDGTTALVALGPPDAEPAPSAGFVLLNSTGFTLDGEPVDPKRTCWNAGEEITAYAGCSIGADLIYRWSVQLDGADASDVVDIWQDAETDPKATIRFKDEANYTLKLEVENGAGIGSISALVCVVNVMPTCLSTLSGPGGAPIDDDDDGDDILCLPAGEIATYDLSGSTGGGLEFTFTCNSTDGVIIDHAAGSTDPTADYSISKPGIYELYVEVTNNKGSCTDTKTICVKSSAVLPEPPANLTATGGEGSVTLVWEAPATGPVPTGYVVYREGTVAPIAEGAFLTYTDTGLANGTEYCYEVKSKVDAAVSATAARACATTLLIERDRFRRGDADGSGKLDLTDAIATLQFLYMGYTAPTCKDAADTDDSGTLDLTDAISSLQFQFMGGTAPADPGPVDCGEDPTSEDQYTECEYTTC